MSLPQGPYNSIQEEPEILNWWLENKFYKPEYSPEQGRVLSFEEMMQDKKETWSLVCPPPNAYGRPHIGNISGYAYMDAFARYQRMNGKRVLVLPGKDHAGLEGEGVFVREVLEKKKINKFDLKREDFYQMMMEFNLENMKKAQKDEMEIGLSADFDRDTFTLDENVVDTVLDTFVEMYKKGMIYKGVRIVNWDPKARTAVADNQIEYKESKTPFFYFKYSFLEPEKEALNLKRNFEGKAIEWKFERDKTKDGKEDLTFAYGSFRIPLLEAMPAGRQGEDKGEGLTIEIMGYGYTPLFGEGRGEGEILKGTVIGIQMRLDNKFRLVVVNPEAEISKEDLNKKIAETFLFESKYYAGAHIILFDEYPEDKFYTNGFVIGTVRPETIFADTAIACDPKDERYKEFVGKEVEVEFLGEKKKLNFIEDFKVDKDFGTGLLKVTPAHAAEDWEIAQRHPEECLPPVQVIGYDLRMNHLAGKYAGERAKDVREMMKDDMKNSGNLVWVDENYENKVQIAERTKAPIEPLLSSQWYLKYDGIKEAATLMMLNAHGDESNLEMSKEELEKEIENFLFSSPRGEARRGDDAPLGSVTLHPKEMVPKFNYWMQNLRDWAISRSLWWGYRLPVWYHGEVKEEIGEDGMVREMINISHQPSATSHQIEIREANKSDFSEMYRIDVEGWLQNFIDEKRGVTEEVLKTKYGKILDDKNSFDKFVKAVEKHDQKSFIAELDNKVVGWINVENINSDEISWVNVYVDRSYQEQGIGSSLMNKIINDFGYLELHVATPEKANLKNFYSKFGFKEYEVEGRVEGEGNLYMIQMKRDSNLLLNDNPTILIDAVKTIINSNENYDLESYSLNKGLADYLKKTGLRIIVVTNADGENLREIKRLLKDYNFEIFTLKNNPSKTNPEFFKKLHEEKNLKLENCIYIDHKQENIDSAKQAGVEIAKVSHENGERIEFIQEKTQNSKPKTQGFIPLEYNNPNHLRVQKESPGEGWFQDEAVLDTWFSSAQWVYATLGKYNLEDKFFPTQLMISGFDILENWISRMMMFTYFKKRSIPFENVYLTGLVKGTDGQKMSKSKGNLINIDDVRTKYGTDAVRMVYFYQNSAGSSYAMTYDKLDNFKKFVNKLWNASRFVLMNAEGIDFGAGHDLYLPEELQLDFSKQIVEHVKKVKQHITKNIENYELGLATFNIYQEFWHEYCDILIEESKQYVLPVWNKETKEVEKEPDAEEKKEVATVMLWALKQYLKMLHPFMPFVTERIWQEMPKSKEAGEHKTLMYTKW